MEELTTLPTPVITRKRKIEPEEKKEPEPSKQSKWSFFTDAQLGETAHIFGEILKAPDSSMSILPSGSHYVLHLRRLGGRIPVQALEEAVQRFHQLHEVRTLTVDLQRQLIDVRFVLNRPQQQTPNVIEIARRQVHEITTSLMKKMKGTGRDSNDWLMISTIMNHAENMLGESTPADLDVSVDTPDAQTLTASGAHENKITRDNYLVRIKGFREVDREHLISFEHLYPHHIHDTLLDFDHKNIQFQLERYASPIIGQVTVLKANIAY